MTLSKVFCNTGCYIPHRPPHLRELDAGSGVVPPSGQLGQSEVSDLGVKLPRHEDVLRLDVAVNMNSTQIEIISQKVTQTR
jgi:hypothetical protein